MVLAFASGLSHQGLLSIHTCRVSGTAAGVLCRGAVLLLRRRRSTGADIAASLAAAMAAAVSSAVSSASAFEPCRWHHGSSSILCHEPFL